MKTLYVCSLILLIVGGLNWGSVSLFDFDLVVWLFGYMTLISRAIYALVGLSALFVIYAYFFRCDCFKK